MTCKISPADLCETMLANAERTERIDLLTYNTLDDLTLAGLDVWKLFWSRWFGMSGEPDPTK